MPNHILSAAETIKRFRPSPLLSLLAILLMLITFRLAWWQFDRAAEKEALEQRVQAGMRAQPINITSTANLVPYRRASGQGQYLPAYQILLDNRLYRRQVGFHVITPLRLANGSVIAVNRGWIAADATQRTANPPSPPTGDITVRGVLQDDEADAFILSEHTESGNIWQNLQLRKYAAISGLPLMTLVLLAQDGDGVLTPAAVRVDFKSTQSTVYAWQWLTFCMITLLFYILLGCRRQVS